MNSMRQFFGVNLTNSDLQRDAQQLFVQHRLQSALGRGVVAGG